MSKLIPKAKLLALLFSLTGLSHLRFLPLVVDISLGERLMSVRIIHHYEEYL